MRGKRTLGLGRTAETSQTRSEQATLSGVGTPAKRTASQPLAASRSRTTGRLTTARHVWPAR